MRILWILPRVLTVLTLCMVLAVPSLSMAARSEGIAVVVNEDAITLSDVNDRMALIIASSGLPNTKDTHNKLMPQIVSALIDEQIRLQEAGRLDLGVSASEIREGFAVIAEQNNFAPEEFRNRLVKGGLNIGTLQDQIRAQIAWSKVVQSELRPQIVVSDSDVDNYLDRLAGNTGKSEYLVAEILLPVASPQEEVQTRELAQNLVRDIRADRASFFKVAQQFSKSAGAPQGGDIGWVAQGQLQKELDFALVNLGPGQISNPIRTASGFHILSIRDKRIIQPENMPSRDQVRSTLGLQRLERLARRYILDLKSAAFIENRLAF